MVAGGEQVESGKHQRGQQGAFLTVPWEALADLRRECQGHIDTSRPCLRFVGFASYRQRNCIVIQPSKDSGRAQVRVHGSGKGWADDLK
jgi:hypothetical protein